MMEKSGLESRFLDEFSWRHLNFMRRLSPGEVTRRGNQISLKVVLELLFLANALVVLSSTTEDGEIEVRISVGVNGSDTTCSAHNPVSVNGSDTTCSAHNPVSVNGSDTTCSAHNPVSVNGSDTTCSAHNPVSVNGSDTTCSAHNPVSVNGSDTTCSAHNPLLIYPHEDELTPFQTHGSTDTFWKHWGSKPESQDL
uniref:Uncharacterized protein n=1 Tax=Timema genevievae TaxID=629358 RepID=A0A7R9PG95_TIMGE|nr:unnamed protein product [Timema genevievae]